MRHVQIGQQERFLLRCPLEHVKKMMQFFLLFTGYGEAHTCLSLRTIVVHDTLTHVQRTHVQQVADISFYGLESCCLGNFGNLNASTLGSEVQNYPFVVAQPAGLVLLIVWVDADCRLAFYLQSRRHRCLVDLTHRAQVVVGNPLPELQLGMAQDGLAVKGAQNLLDFVALGLPVMEGCHDGRKDFFASEGYQNAHTDR